MIAPRLFRYYPIFPLVSMEILKSMRRGTTSSKFAHRTHHNNSLTDEKATCSLLIYFFHFLYSVIVIALSSNNTSYPYLHSPLRSFFSILCILSATSLAVIRISFHIPSGLFYYYVTRKSFSATFYSCRPLCT